MLFATAYGRPGGCVQTSVHRSEIGPKVRYAADKSASGYSLLLADWSTPNLSIAGCRLRRRYLQTFWETEQRCWCSR